MDFFKINIECHPSGGFQIVLIGPDYWEAVPEPIQDMFTAVELAHDLQRDFYTKFGSVPEVRLMEDAVRKNAMTSEKNSKAYQDIMKIVKPQKRR